MSFRKQGGCQCGAIRYEITGAPAVFYTVIARMPEAVRLRPSRWRRSSAGALPHHQGRAENVRGPTSATKTMECWFCADCGTRLYPHAGRRSYPNRNNQAGKRWTTPHGSFPRFISGRGARRTGCHSDGDLPRTQPATARVDAAAGSDADQRFRLC